MEILNQFGIDSKLLLAQIVNFAVLLFILKRFLYKPILKVLSERKQKIEESLKNAQEIEKRLLETEEEKEKILVKASSEAQKLLDETRKELEILREDLKKNAEEQAAQIIKKGEEAARAGSLRMEQEVMGKVADIVASALEKVTGKVLTAKDQKEILEKEIRNLS